MAIKKRPPQPPQQPQQPKMDVFDKYFSITDQKREAERDYRLQKEGYVKDANGNLIPPNAAPHPTPKGQAPNPNYQNAPVNNPHRPPAPNSRKERRNQQNVQREMRHQEQINSNKNWNDTANIAQNMQYGNAPQVQPQTQPQPQMQVQPQVNEQTAINNPPAMEQCVNVVGCSTSIGRREYQQDALKLSSNPGTEFTSGQWLAILCDGMGGMNGGEKASALCIEQMVKAFNESVPIKSVPEFYYDEIINMDEMVASLTDETGNYLGAGSTLISVVIDNGKLYWASVGDSHIYLIRGAEIVRVNKEHNYLVDLLEQVQRGEITEAEAYSDPSKEALTSFMGIGNISLIDVRQTPVELMPNDCIILCSDGLYRSLSQQEMYSILYNNFDDMQNAADMLVQTAVGKGNLHQDNTTAITIRYK